MASKLSRNQRLTGLTSIKSGESQQELLSAAAVLLVGIDDALHDAVADDVPRFEADEVDSFGSLQNTDGLDQP